MNNISHKVKPEHVMDIQGENIEQRNNAPNGHAKRATTSNPQQGWSNFFKRKPSIERKAILLLSIAAVTIDPLFFYIPVVKKASTCLGLDKNLRIIVVVLRSCVDLLHTILWWHHSFPLIHGYRPWLVPILAILPLPQVVIYGLSWLQLTVKLLKFMVLIQFVIRLCRIIPAYKDAKRSSNMLHIHMWFAAAFNLVMYIIASNVLGAFWYLRAIERNMECWKRACHKNLTLCGDSPLYCDNTSSSSYNEPLYEVCSLPTTSNATFFDYGIYDEAFQTMIIDTDTHFQDKLLHCFWWGLRNLSHNVLGLYLSEHKTNVKIMTPLVESLTTVMYESRSSLGQNLQTGAYIWDSFFAISIAVSGLVLFALLIGNMQTYLQTKTPAKLERMKQRKEYLEGWKPFYLLPEELRREVTWCEDPKWQETAEVNLESLLNNIPTALRKKLRPHLCKDMFLQIPEFKNLCTRPRDELCALAKPVVFSQRSYILREGDPIHELVFVVQGNLLSYSKHNTQKGASTKPLSDGCFFGEKLLQLFEQASRQQQAPNDFLLDLPIASETVQATSRVEAFTLSTKDLNKVLATYHGHLYKSNDWATFTIQEAWRKRAKAKQEEKPQQRRCGLF